MSETDVPEPAVRAAADLRPVLADFDIERAAVEAALDEPPGADAELVDVLARHAHEQGNIGKDYGGDLPEKKKNVLLDLLSEKWPEIVVDNRYGHKVNVEHVIDDAVGQYGYGFAFEPHGTDEWVEPEHETHPRAFVLSVTDGHGDVVSETGFRYPPYSGPRHVTNELRFLVEGLNHVLSDAGLQLRLQNDRDGMFWLLLFEQASLSELEETYGESLERPGSFDPLVESGPRFTGLLADIDETQAVDHEAAFGVPEPDDVFKIEDEFEV